MEITVAATHSMRLSWGTGFRVSGAGWELAVRLAPGRWIAWQAFRHHSQEGVREVCCRDSCSGLEAVTRFSQVGAAVWRRVDQLRNAGSETLTVLSCLPVFPFAEGEYAIYSQDSRWSHENQGGWEALTHGERVLRCTYGRTAQGGTPWIGLREPCRQGVLAFHVAPYGNWMIRCRRGQHGGDTLPDLQIGLGLDDRDLALSLAPGETLSLPPVTVQELPAGDIESGAAPLHKVLCKSMPVCAAGIPLVYNTWFDVFDKLDTQRLRRQLDAACAAGCEVFVVDAGWYGRGDGWACQGDWHEKQDRAFHGRMRAFADEVRTRGLGFGLWMEPEAIQPSAPVARDQPSWFLDGPGGARWPDPRNADARDWIHAEIARLIETYGVVWLKIDFNQPIGPDPEYAALSRYYQRWYELLDHLRQRFPNTFFENCAGGGQRLEGTALRHSHGHFLSDTVEPIDGLRILQGALLRLPPGALIHWAVLRSVGPTIPLYGRSPDETPARLVTPCGATWDRAVTVDLDFAVCAAFPGILGFSGDLASLSATQCAKLASWARAWKCWRQWMRGAHAVLLTPVRPLADRSGWVGLQLARDDDDAVLLFVYRLDDPRSRFRVQPRGVFPDRRYVATALPDGTGSELSGTDLADRGLDVFLRAPCRASALVLRPCASPAASAVT